MESEERYFVLTNDGALLSRRFAPKAKGGHGELEDARDVALRIRAKQYKNVPIRIRDGRLLVVDSRGQTSLTIRRAHYV